MQRGVEPADPDGLPARRAGEAVVHRRSAADLAEERRRREPGRAGCLCARRTGDPEDEREGDESKAHGRLTVGHRYSTTSPWRIVFSVITRGSTKDSR